MEKKFFTFILILVFATDLYCQNFKAAPLIELPGDNVEYDLLSVNLNGTYITWLNIKDSIYTIYLKQLSPIISEDIIVTTDQKIKSKPQIALNRFSQEVKIVWQSYDESAWKVYLKKYSENQLSDSVLILDSIFNDPQISLSTHRLAWIEDGNIFIKNLDSDMNTKELIDSANCASPDLGQLDHPKITSLLYEKVFFDSVKIYLLSYNEYRTQNYIYECISPNLINKNPQFGMEFGITFQEFENGVWKSAYYTGSTDSTNFFTTNNKQCNYENPFLFIYDVPTSSNENKTPFFLAFDTDTLTGNSEIFIKTFYFGTHEKLLNISHSEGNDYNPKVAYLKSSDSVFVSIFWTHTANNKTDIWFAKDYFSPIISSVNITNETENQFILGQNFPNPFNPETTIVYNIPYSNHVTLEIYNILGQRIKKLVDEFQYEGIYKITFDASELPTGVYIYRLKSGSYTDSKKMLILK